jgi:hypothetical protein
MAKVMCSPVPGSNNDMMWMVHCVLNNPELGSKRCIDLNASSGNCCLPQVPNSAFLGLDIA